MLLTPLPTLTTFSSWWFFIADQYCAEIGWSVINVTILVHVCVKKFRNVLMTWSEAYLFCKQHNSSLVSLKTMHQLSLPGEGRCWVENIVYASEDPLEGWQWTNGSLYDHGHRWGLSGNLNYPDVQKRCAVIDPVNRIWKERPCTSYQHFICKKQVG